MNCATGDIACELARIARALEGFDWNGFASTLLATLIGAGVAAGVSFWLAERDRPRPMWRAFADIPHGIVVGSGSANARVVVTNIGDGAAYHPRVSVSGPMAKGASRGSEAVLEPGEQMTIWVRIGVIEKDDETLIAWPTDLAALLEWHEPPRRRKTRRATVVVDR